jgi:hypothetical protein
MLETEKPVMTQDQITEAFQFIFDACARLNDADAVGAGLDAMLAEELTDIQNVAGDALSTIRRELPGSRAAS